MRKNKGFAIVTALGLLMIIMIIVAVLSATSASEIKQGQMRIQTAQARAIADAGEVYASAAIQGEAQALMGELLKPYIRQNIDPEAQWSIRKSNWSSIAPKIESLLNNNFNTLGSDALDGLGQASIEYKVSGFRGNRRTPNIQTYVVNYSVISEGTTEKATRRVENKGVFEIKVGYAVLSRYLFLVEDAAGEHGFFPTGTVFNGPVHANHNWGFYGRPEFLSDISTSDSGAWYYRGNCRRGPWKLHINGDSRPGCTNPFFANGFRRNAPPIELPKNSLSQQKVTLGMDPELGGGAPNSGQICGALHLDCAAGIPDGVYLAYNTDDPNGQAFISGGIYVQGNLDSLEMDAASIEGVQIYTFEQNGKTYTITLNYNINKTTIHEEPADTTVEYNGVPNGAVDSDTGATGQIYVTGSIAELKGPNRTGNGPLNDPQDHPPSDRIPPALARETQLNISANQEIRLTSDIVYECDPTMLSDQPYLDQHPRCDIGPDALLPTVLGVMSVDQDIVMTTDMPDDPYIWGSYLAGDGGKGLSVENYNSRGAQGTMRLFGGLLQSVDQFRGTYSNGHLHSGFIETFDYDNRFAQGLISPPNFPRSGEFSFQNAYPTKLSYKEF